MFQQGASGAAGKLRKGRAGLGHRGYRLAFGQLVGASLEDVGSGISLQ